MLNSYTRRNIIDNVLLFARHSHDSDLLNIIIDEMISMDINDLIELQTELSTEYKEAMSEYSYVAFYILKAYLKKNNLLYSLTYSGEPIESQAEFKKDLDAVVHIVREHVDDHRYRKYINTILSSLIDYEVVIMLTIDYYIFENDDAKHIKDILSRLSTLITHTDSTGEYIIKQNIRNWLSLASDEFGEEHKLYKTMLTDILESKRLI